jgi:hypothetical protein
VHDTATSVLRPATWAGPFHLGVAIQSRAPSNTAAVGTDRPAIRSHHARPERRQGEIAGEVVDVENHAMATLVALDVERPHTVVAHVLQRHRLDGVVETASGHNAKAPHVAGLS